MYASKNQNRLEIKFIQDLSKSFVISVQYTETIPKKIILQHWKDTKRKSKHYIITQSKKKYKNLTAAI